MILLLKTLSDEVQHYLSILIEKKFSVPDISDITEDFTNAKGKILNEIFDVAVHCLLISHGKYYSLIEQVAIHP